MNAEEYVQRGTAFFQEGKIEQAFESIQKAWELQPGNAEIRELFMKICKAWQSQAKASEARNRADVLRDTEGITDIEKAITDYTDVLRRNPNDASAKSILDMAYYIRGLIFDSKEEYTQALAAYNEAINNEPNHPYAFDKRGGVNEELGNWDEAIKDYEKVVQFKPNEDMPKRMLPNVYSGRGMAYYRKGDYARAVSDYETALKFWPDDNANREYLEMAKAELAKK